MLQGCFSDREYAPVRTARMRHLFARQASERRSVLWHLVRAAGRRGVAFLADFLLPVLGFLFCLNLWVHLTGFALRLGTLWMALGLLHLSVLTRGFNRQRLAA